MENRKVLLGIVLVVALALGLWAFLSQRGDGKTESQSKTLSSFSGNSGNIKLSSSPNGTYVPKEIRVRVGDNVRIEGDTETLVGGMDTVIIDGYGIRKTIVPGDNMIEFVADKKGTFKVYCANGMGKGKLIVE